MNLRFLRSADTPAGPSRPRVLLPEDLEELSPEAVARLMEFVRARPFMVNLDQRTERRLDEFMTDHNATLALSAEDELHGAEGLELALMMCVERGLEAFDADRTGGVR